MDHKNHHFSPDGNFQEEYQAFNSRAEKFKLIFNASPDMIFILSHTGLILDANEAALTVYGYEHSEVFGMSFDSLISSSNYKKNARKLFDAVARGAEIDYEWVTATKNGKNIPVEVRLRSLKVSEDDDKSAVVLILRDISTRQKADEAINSLARATNLTTVDDFLRESVQSLAKLYGTKFAFIGRLHEDKQNVTTLAVWAGDQIVDNFTYSLEGTPCKDVMDLKVELIPDRASEIYAEDELLVQMGIQSYFGHPMVAEGKMMGLVSVMDDKELVIEEWAAPILGLFANRLAVEIERYEVTRELQQSKQNLEVLIEERTQKVQEQADIIEKNNRDLEEANQEMKSFCYSVSHDLRAPLRGISGFSEVILEDYEDKLDELGKEYLHRIKDTTVNMSGLIDGMLQLSRVSHQEPVLEDVNLSLIADEVLVGLSSMDKDRKVNFTIEADLTCQADRGLIVILLQNILGNAWKYTAKNKNAKIEMRREFIDGQNTFVIKDNGAGFDMKFAGKLFEPFKRLHGETEFAGSGIGLATAKSVVKKHGGSIWAKSKVDEGSTFYFNLCRN